MAVLIFAIFMVSGCAAGKHHNYANLVVQVDPIGHGPIEVSVSDIRSYVRYKRKSPKFVGLQRGRFGIPFDVVTESGQPLAVDMATTLRKTFVAMGFDPVSIVTPACGETKRTTRCAMLVVREWKSDTMRSVAIHYNLSLEVQDSSGKTIAEHSLRGADSLGGKLTRYGGADHAEQAAPAAFRRHLSLLLSDPAIDGALRASR